MKRGISFALQAAGMLLVCLAATVNHSVIAVEVDNLTDTVNYYNERGRRIARNVHAPKAGNFAIRTCKTKDELFEDYNKRNPDEKSDTSYKPADVRNISRKRARKVTRLLRMGVFMDTVVTNYIVPILPKKNIKKMYKSIGDSGNNIRWQDDFREYGGLIKTDSSFTLVVGDTADPRSLKRPGLDLTGKGIGEFHSHPSGAKGVSSFIQGTSQTDVEALTDLQKKGKIPMTGYVFGMNARSHMIYIYDSAGIKATLPFKFMRRK
jgi:hypothetical protein